MSEEDIMTDEQFTAAVIQWGNMVRNKARANAGAFTKGKQGTYGYNPDGKSKNAGRTEKKLATAIGYRIRRFSGDINNVSFQFPLHGIFRAFGVGNGQPGEDSYAKRTTKTYIKRSKSDWINSPIENSFEAFAKLSTEYYGDKVMAVVRNTKIKDL